MLTVSINDGGPTCNYRTCTVRSSDGWRQTAPDVITAYTVLVHKYCTVLFTFSNFILHSAVHHLKVLPGSHSRCRDVMVYVSDRNQPSLPAPDLSEGKSFALTTKLVDICEESTY